MSNPVTARRRRAAVLPVVLLTGAVLLSPVLRAGKAAGFSAPEAGRQIAQAAASTQDDLGAAMTAVTAVEDDGTLGSADACLAETQGVKCIVPMSTPQQAAAGLAYFSVGVRGDSGWADIAGRDPGGVWHYWFGGQQFDEDMVNLPQQVTVCAADGLNVRAGGDGDAPVVSVLLNGTTAQVDAFVLTEPTVSPRANGEQLGSGWYHLAGAADGWVRSSYVATTASIAVYYGCQLHYP